jgi:hypothetical protein
MDLAKLTGTGVVLGSEIIGTVDVERRSSVGRWIVCDIWMGTDRFYGLSDRNIGRGLLRGAVFGVVCAFAWLT